MRACPETHMQEVVLVQSFELRHIQLQIIVPAGNYRQVVFVAQPMLNPVAALVQ